MYSHHVKKTQIQTKKTDSCNISEIESCIDKKCNQIIINRLKETYLMKLNDTFHPYKKFTMKVILTNT